MKKEKESPIGNFIDSTVDKIFFIGEKALWYTGIALVIYIAFCVFLFFQIKNIDTNYEFVRALFLILAVLVLLFTLSLPVRFIFALLSAKLLKSTEKTKDVAAKTSPVDRE
jgi:predicted branched-subunit amino acid permease